MEIRSNSISYPLVSVVIVTYNSAKYVKDTLESVKSQTYPSLELVISDDNSKDETIEICNNWLNDNEGRFHKSKLLVSEINTGTCANLNRGIRASEGVWIKSLAGDDLLEPNSIMTYIRQTLNENYEFFVCKLKLFSDDYGVSKQMIDSYESFYQKAKEPFADKKKRIVLENIFPGPAYFYTRNLYDKIGGFDEKYKLMEEWPFIYKTIDNGYDIGVICDQLVRYRISNNSVCHSGNAVNFQFFYDNMMFFRSVLFKDMIKNGHYYEALKKVLYYISRNWAYRRPNNPLVKVIKYVRK